MKNDAFWSIVRTLLIGIIAFFLVMQYWSSDLVEERLIQIQKKIDAMQAKIDTIQLIRMESKPVENKLQKENPDSKYPNLLVDDPFDEHILPEMLGSHFKPYPLKFLATIGKPENLHPFANWLIVSQAYSYCLGTAGRPKTGFYEIYSPYFATRVEERLDPDGKGGAFWVFLRDDIFWQPLKQNLFPDNVQLAPHFLKPYPVTAHDFKFYYDVSMNPFNQETSAVVQRQQFQDLEDFVVVDDHTFYMRWKYREFKEGDKTVYRRIYRATLLTIGSSPLPRFVYQYYPDGSKIIADDQAVDAYRTNSSFAQQFMEHFAKNYIVSIGPYDFNGFDDSGLNFIKIPQFFDPVGALYNEVEIAFRNSQDSIWSDFKTGKMSVYELPSYQLPEYERFLGSSIYAEQKKNGQAIKRLDYLNRTFTYIGWNEKNPLFKDREVRQALSYAIDVDRIIHELLNDLAVRIVGPISNDSSNINPHLKPIPYDPSKARELLKAQGWKDMNGNGVLSKEIDGKMVPFSFSLTYFVKSTIGKAIAEVVSGQLKNVGIQCDPKGVEVADLSAKIDDKDFEAVMMAWALAAPPEDPRQIWSSEGKTLKGSSNFISFGNDRVDEIIHLLDYENDKEKRKQLYWEFQEILYQQQPYTFLFTPMATLLYRETVENVFIPKNRQDLIPGAVVSEPISSIFYERLSD